MSETSKVVEDTPCWDTGSLMKTYLNTKHSIFNKNKAIAQSVPVTVVGYGSCDSADTNDFVNKNGEKFLYFSYRNCFPKLPNGSTTDTNWGCLVRTGQMLIAHCFMRFYGGGGNSIPDDNLTELREKTKPLFYDTPRAPFSLHQVEKYAHANGSKYARWLSPTEACRAFYGCCLDYHGTGAPCPYPICCEDRNINKELAYQVLRRGEPILYLIPVVMGVKKLNDKYQRMLLRCLEMEHCCGVAGGVGLASVYMFGHQGTNVFYLDPHFVQTAYLSEDTEGRMASKRGSIAVKKIDPCMLLGFYIPNETEFDNFLVEMKEMNSFVPFPLISVSEGDPQKKAQAGNPLASAPSPGSQASAPGTDEEQANRIIVISENPLSPSTAGTRVPSMYPTG